MDKLIGLMIKYGFSKTHWLLVQLALNAVDVNIHAGDWAKAYAYSTIALPGLQLVKDINNSVVLPIYRSVYYD